MRMPQLYARFTPQLEPKAIPAAIYWVRLVAPWAVFVAILSAAFLAHNAVAVVVDAVHKHSQRSLLYGIVSPV